MPLRSRIIRIVALFATGLFVALLFPPYNFGEFVWVCLLPLLLVLWTGKGKRLALRGFAATWFAGVVSFGIQFRWLSEVSLLGALVLPLYLALFWGLFGAWGATLGNPWRANKTERGLMTEILRSLGFSAATAAVWAGQEWLRSWLLTGFGWNPLGTAFHETPVMAQAADLLGACGLSMVPVFFQSVLLQAGKRIIDSAKDGKRRTRLDFAIAVIFVGLIMGYGILRIQTEGRGETIRLKALLVQLNIPQEAARMLWSAEETHMAYEDETIAALEAIAAADDESLKNQIKLRSEGKMELQQPDWVVWPETALTGRILRSEDGAWGMWRDNLDTIERVRSAGNFQLIFGVNELEARKTDDGQLVAMHRGKAWNSLAVLSPDQQLQTFRKHHLVIFGETIPFVDSLPWLKRIYEQQAGVEFGGSFSAGTSFEPLPVPTRSGAALGLIPTVCFEDSVPRLVRRFVRPEPQVIVNVTNDGWFKESAAAEQHFANARFRAIELRRPMIRCANTGVSVAVDSIGSLRHPDTGVRQILEDESGNHFTRGSRLVSLDVPMEPSTTLYSIIGDWGIIILSLTGLTAPLLAGRKKRGK